MRVVGFGYASFSIEMLFQPCYPHILQGNNEKFTLLYNNEEQYGSRFLMFPAMFHYGRHRGGHQKPFLTLFFIIEILQRTNWED